MIVSQKFEEFHCQACIVQECDDNQKKILESDQKTSENCYPWTLAVKLSRRTRLELNPQDRFYHQPLVFGLFQLCNA